MRSGKWVYFLGAFSVLAFLWLAIGSPTIKANAGKDSVRALMRDPSSVQFRNVEARRIAPPLNEVVCGEFNAKNGFNAYTGFKRFYAFRDGDVRMEGKYAKFEDGWLEFCLK